MPKFAANLSMLWNELPFLDRFEAAARAGFTAVEFLFPYEFQARTDRAAAAGSTSLQLVLHNMPPGDWAGGERGTASLPWPRGRIPRGRDAKALQYATVLGSPQPALHGRHSTGRM